MATYSITLAWKIPWMEKPGRLQSMGSQRVGHDWETSLSLFFRLIIAFLPRSKRLWISWLQSPSAVILETPKISHCLQMTWLFAIPWTIVYQASLSMGFSRQEYWSGLPFPSPGDLPNPGIEPGSPTLQADSLLPEPPEILPQLISTFSGRFYWVEINKWF